jgi:hypothetical protein
MSRWFGLLAERWAAKTGRTPVAIELILSAYPTRNGDVSLGTFTARDARYRSASRSGSNGR